MARWVISVDAGKCIGSAVCIGTAPGRFALNQAQRSVPVEPETGADEAVRDAAASCPTEAISITDADTGELIDLD